MQLLSSSKLQNQLCKPHPVLSYAPRITQPCSTHHSAMLTYLKHTQTSQGHPSTKHPSLRHTPILPISQTDPHSSNHSTTALLALSFSHTPIHPITEPHVALTHHSATPPLAPSLSHTTIHPITEPQPLLSPSLSHTFHIPIIDLTNLKSAPSTQPHSHHSFMPPEPHQPSHTHPSTKPCSPHSDMLPLHSAMLLLKTLSI